jgi:hypothetical protein
MRINAERRKKGTVAENDLKETMTRKLGRLVERQLAAHPAAQREETSPCKERACRAIARLMNRCDAIKLRCGSGFH